MRILQIHAPYREGGGEDTVVRVESELLRSAGHTVLEHIVPNPRAPAQTLGALALAPWNPLAARSVRAVALRFRPDVAHLHNTWFSLSPSVPAAVHDLGVPLVMTIHNYRLMCVNGLLFRDGRICEECVATHPWRGLRHRCFRGSAPLSAVAASTIALSRVRNTWQRSIDRFIAPSAFAGAKIAEGGADAQKIVVKPHGVHDPGPRREPPSQSSTVLFVGRLSYEKGLQSLLDGWDRARPESLRLVVVGDGVNRKALQERRIPGVEFLGWRHHNDVRRLMLEARALVFPSIWYESFALTVVEALAAGLPVLALDLGAAGDIVRTVDPGSLVPSGDAAGWAASLRHLEAGRNLDIAGNRARQVFEARYTLDRSLEQLVDIYGEVVTGSRSGTNRPAARTVR